MHRAVAVAKQLGARMAAVAEDELAATDGKAYVTTFAKRLAERRVTKPTRQLPWIALVDALVEDRLAVELDHPTFPEDVIDALDELRSLPKSRSRWTWVRDVDDSTSTAKFLAAAVHHAKLPLATIDLDSDSIVVVVTKDGKKLGLAPIAAEALSAPRPASRLPTTPSSLRPRTPRRTRGIAASLPARSAEMRCSGLCMARRTSSTRSTPSCAVASASRRGRPRRSWLRFACPRSTGRGA